MVNLIRKAKPCSQWGQYELLSFNITVENQDAVAFFGSADLPEPDVDPELLTAKTFDAFDDAVKDENYDLLVHLFLTIRIDHSTVGDFTKTLFERTKIVTRGHTARTRAVLPLEMFCQMTTASPDVVLYDIRSTQRGIILVVHEEKRWEHRIDLFPQLMADAVAAYQHNSHAREGQPVHDSVIYGITMNGTMPTFYKIPMTQDLVRGIRMGFTPQNPTKAARFSPLIHSPHLRWTEGMKPLENRRAVFQYLEALRRLL